MSEEKTTAAAFVRPSVRITRDRGHPIESSLAPVAALTIHPSAVLRLREHGEREEALGELIEDLRQVVREMTRRG